MFIVRTFVTKPAGKAWYKHDPALGTQTLAQFVASKEAVLKHRTRKLGKNKKVGVMVFADQASYEAFKAELDASPLQQAKTAHQEANGFVVVVRKFQLVA